jgi:hypothetical protein
MQTIDIIAALLKLTIEGYAAYAKTQGISDADIERVFQQVRLDVISHDPANLPN